MIKFRSVDDLKWRFPTLFEIRNKNWIIEGTAELSNTSNIYYYIYYYTYLLLYFKVYTHELSGKSQWKN